METFLIFLLLLAVVVLPFVGTAIHRRAKAAGGRRWESKKEQQAGIDGLGATITLSTDESTARELVTSVLAHTRRVRAHDNGTWAHTHYNTDDVVYELVPAAQDAPGVMLAVARAIEFGGTLNGVKEWHTLREQVREAATSRGVGTTPGVRPLFHTAETNGTGAAIWRPLS